MRKLSHDIAFLYEMGSLRFVERTWRQFFETTVANDSEHIFRVIWIALVIAQHEGVTNEEKIMKLALVHDIGETRCPDSNYLSKLYSSRNEEKAITDMLENTSLKGEFLELYRDYAKRESVEAKVVKDADNLDVDFEIQEQASKGNDIRKLWTRKDVREKLFTETAKQMWDELQTSNPKAWHVDAHKKVSKK